MCEKIKEWFSYSNDNGFEYFETELEAKESAESEIQGYLQDGWSEEVTSVIVGKVTAKATQTNREDRPDDSELDEDGCDSDGYSWEDFEYRCNYELKGMNNE